MAIIIRDGDIVDISNQNVLTNNKVKKVSVLQKIIEIGDKEINTERDANGLYSVGTSSETFFTATHNVSGNLVRIEVFGITGSFEVSKENYPLFTKDNIQWTLTGTKVSHKPKNFLPNKHQMADDTTSCMVGNYSGEQPPPTYSDFSQQGNWGENGIVTLNFGGTVTSYNDNNFSFISVEEQETKYVVTYQIATRIANMSATGSEGSGEYGTVINLTEEIYYANNLRFDLYVDGVSVKDASISNTYGDKDSFFQYFMNTNTLYQSETTCNNETLASYNASKILSNWGNGKESAEIQVVVGEYYDENNNLCISSENNNLPMTFKIGDTVIPYVKSAKEIQIDGQDAMLIEESGLAQYYNGEAKRFVVVNSSIIDDGVVTQKLTLVESSIAKEIRIETDNHTSVTITRMSSNYDVPLGELSELVAYKGDTLKVSVSTEYTTWLYLVLLLNGEPISNNGTFVVDGDIEITAKAKSLEQLSWEQIAIASQDGQADKLFNIGDTKTFSLSNGEEITVAILDFNHDDLSSGTGKASMTFGMLGVLQQTYRMSQYNESQIHSWEQSEFRTNDIPTILLTLPNELQSALKQVNKKTLKGNWSGTEFTPVTTVDKLFLFSTDEVTSGYGWNSGDEGSIYPYFVDKLGEGIANYTNWWLRSPSQNDDTKYYKLSKTGSGIVSKGGSDTATTYNSICLGFCI